MVRIIFDGSSIRLNKIDQTGSGAISYFEGLPPYLQQRGFGNVGRGGGALRQHGAGVGAILRNLWRYLKPIAKGVGKELGQEGLATTARVLNKVAEGGNVQEAVMGESQEGVRKLARKAAAKLQGGGGGHRTVKKHPRSKSGVILKPSDVIGKTVPQKALLKKKRIDTLGYY